LLGFVDDLHETALEDGRRTSDVQVDRLKWLLLFGGIAAFLGFRDLFMSSRLLNVAVTFS
jgi:hypothetical protein